MLKVNPFAYAIIAACSIAGIVVLAVFAPSGFAVGAGVVTTLTMAAFRAAKNEEPKQ